MTWKVAATIALLCSVAAMGWSIQRRSPGAPGDRAAEDREFADDLRRVRDAERDLDRRAATGDLAVSADELTDAYARDPTAANAKYGMKFVRVTGLVIEPPQSNLAQGSVWLAGALPVQADFKGNGTSLPTLIEPGTTLTAVGTCVGCWDRTIVINGCHRVQ